MLPGYGAMLGCLPEDGMYKLAWMRTRAMPWLASQFHSNPAIGRLGTGDYENVDWGNLGFPRGMYGHAIKHGKDSPVYERIPEEYSGLFDKHRKYVTGRMSGQDYYSGVFKHRFGDNKFLNWLFRAFLGLFPSMRDPKPFDNIPEPSNTQAALVGGLNRVSNFFTRGEDSGSKGQTTGGTLGFRPAELPSSSPDNTAFEHTVRP